MSRAFEEAVLSNPQRWALFLDIDGTLIDVAPEPDQVRIPAELPGLLQTLDEYLGGALALNTGRQLAVVDEMLAPMRFSASGVHGTEIRLDPAQMPEILAPRVPTALLDALVREIGPSDVIVIEDKRVGLAVHYRKAPELAEAVAGLVASVMRAWPDYQVKPGRKIFEIIPRGFSKATAISRFLKHEPFTRRVPLVIGDDSGDEPAIAMARALGGAAFTVAGEHFPAREADFASASAVRASLSKLLEALTPTARTAARG